MRRPETDDEVHEIPKWWDLVRRADDMIRGTGDEHPFFLEGLEPAPDIDGIAVYEFQMNF